MVQSQCFIIIVQLNGSFLIFFRIKWIVEKKLILQRPSPKSIQKMSKLINYSKEATIIAQIIFETMAQIGLGVPWGAKDEISFAIQISILVFDHQEIKLVYHVLFNVFGVSFTFSNLQLNEFHNMNLRLLNPN